jgi:hypothetical protein
MSTVADLEIGIHSRSTESILDPPQNPQSSRNIPSYGSLRFQGLEDFLYKSLSVKDRFGRSVDPHASGPQDLQRPGAKSTLETSLNVTEERLRLLFSLFDKDNSGRISYEEMKKGLQFHHGGELDDNEEIFLQLISFLDVDGSGDISFEEFSEGIRLLMLRALLRAELSTKHAGAITRDDSVITQVFDYDPQNLERRIVERSGEATADSTSRSEPILRYMSLTDFLFADRPDWVTVRWINITGGPLLKHTGCAVLGRIRTSHFIQFYPSGILRR